MTIYTNPETNKAIQVFVHEVVHKNGKQMALVNKGNTQTKFTFLVPVSDTNLVAV